MKGCIGKTIMMVLFILIVLMFMTMSFSLQYPLQLGKNLVNVVEIQNTDNDASILDIENQYVENFGLKAFWIELSGLVAKTLHMNNYYSDSNIYITHDNTVWSREDKTSTDYEVEQTMKLKQFLDTEGVDLLYVNAPVKYMEDAEYEHQFAVTTYSNRNADLFLKRIRKNGVACLDLRECIQDEQIDINKMFYRADHHWTVESGLWATQHTVEYMNREFGYSMPEDNCQINQFDSQKMEKCWLGEQGAKVGSDWLGLEDFTLLRPKTSTDFVISNPTIDGLQDGIEGNFDSLINYGVYETTDDVYTKGSYHFSYIPWGAEFTTIVNRNIPDGKKILLLGDSYSQVVEPFLALTSSSVTVMELRYCDIDLPAYIKANEFDAVVIMYAEFMIGAHDDEGNSNYRMFQFCE